MISGFVLLCLVAASRGFFQQMFGGGEGGMQFEFGGGGHPFGGGRRRTQDANVDVQVTLEDFYKGKSLQLSFERRAVCDTCKGSGAKSLKKCPHCNGRGVVRHPMHPIQQHCPHCGGQGKIASTKCPKCRGQKVHRETVSKEVALPKGAPDGHKVRLKGLADEAPGVEPGDVVVSIKPTDHSTFSRSGSLLKTTVPISLGEALLGFSRTVNHLDGHTVSLSESTTTRHLKKKNVRGEGMPVRINSKAFGDLEVTYHVRYPSRLSQAQIDAVGEAFPEEVAAIEEALEAGAVADAADEEDEGDDYEDGSDDDSDEL